MFRSNIGHMLFKKITMGQELVSWVGTLGTYLYFFI